MSTTDPTARLDWIEKRLRILDGPHPSHEDGYDPHCVWCCAELELETATKTTTRYLLAELQRLRAALARCEALVADGKLQMMLENLLRRMYGGSTRVIRRITEPDGSVHFREFDYADVERAIELVAALASSERQGG